MTAKNEIDTPQTTSPSYKLSYTDTDFLTREELRPIRLQLELLKPELLQKEHGVEATVVIFGGSRIPEPHQARKKFEQDEKAAASDPTNIELQKELKIAEAILNKSR